MKIPKTRNKYCPYCRKHTEHKISESKQKTFGTAHPLSRGTRSQKRYKARTGNKGRYSRPPIKKWKMTGKKQTKKIDLRYQCPVCKKIHTQSSGVRLRRLEFT